MRSYRGGGYGPGGGGVSIVIPPFTPAIKWIAGISGGLWLLQFVLLKSVGTDPLTAVFGVVPNDVIRGRIWQPLTYALLHSPFGIGHVLINMLFLWMFGGDLERAWGWRAFVRYYVVCAGGAGVLIVLLGLASGSGGVPTIGASGAIYGVIVAYGMLFGDRVVYFMMFFPMKARWFAAIAFGLQLFLSVSGGSPGTSHVAHVGGGLVGFLFLKRVWRIGAFYRELRWRMMRRKYRIVRDDDDRWMH